MRSLRQVEEADDRGFVWSASAIGRCLSTFLNQCLTWAKKFCNLSTERKQLGNNATWSRHVLKCSALRVLKGSREFRASTFCHQRRLSLSQSDSNHVPLSAAFPLKRFCRAAPISVTLAQKVTWFHVLKVSVLFWLQVHFVGRKHRNEGWVAWKMEWGNWKMVAQWLGGTLKIHVCAYIGVHFKTFRKTRWPCGQGITCWLLAMTRTCGSLLCTLVACCAEQFSTCSKASGSVCASVLPHWLQLQQQQQTDNWECANNGACSRIIPLSFTENDQGCNTEAQEDMLILSGYEIPFAWNSPAGGMSCRTEKLSIRKHPLTTSCVTWVEVCLQT